MILTAIWNFKPLNMYMYSFEQEWRPLNQIPDLFCLADKVNSESFINSFHPVSVKKDQGHRLRPFLFQVLFHQTFVVKTHIFQCE